MIASVAVDEALLALKIGFLVLLYLFIWMIVRSATRDLRVVPQESIVLGPSDVAAARAAATNHPAELVVVSSPTLQSESRIALNAPTQVGRSADCEVQLETDEYVSSRHARFDPRLDGLWLEDLGSTNGTFVNGARVTTARLLQRGDVVRIGSTDLQVGT